MARDKLLQEAIADAKLVRETAIANAKAQMEEHFRSTISNKLNEAKEEKEVKEGIEDTSGIGSGGVAVDNPGPKDPSRDAWGSSDIPNPGQEKEPMGKGSSPETQKPIQEHEDEFGKEDDELAGGDMNLDLDMTGGEGGGDDLDLDVTGGEEEPHNDYANGDGQLDLERIIRELEADVHDDDMSDMQKDTEHHHPYEEGFDDVRAGQEVDGPIKVGRRDEKADVTGYPDKEAPKSVEGVPGGEKITTPGKEVHGSKEGITENIDLDEILREIDIEESKKLDEQKKIISENAELKTRLREYSEIVKYLRSRLQEINLLNSKLLFTNKIFKSFNLTQPQKMRVVENFDRATNVREAKLVYTTLAESLGTKKERPKNNTTVTTVTEGISSKVGGSTKPRSVQADSVILTEGDDMMRRMQQLAGIIKN